MTAGLFHDFLDQGAESKLELIDSRLIVGNTIVGSRLLLRQILQGWGASAAVALAPLEQSVEALSQLLEGNVLHLWIWEERGNALPRPLSLLSRLQQGKSHQPCFLLRRT